MKGNLLNLIDQAQLALSDLTSVADSLHQKMPTGPDEIISRRIHLAKSQGQSALDKLKNILLAEEVEDID